MLSSLSLRGNVGGSLSFEIHGTVRAKEEQKIPLFGPPSQVHIDDATLDGGRATLGFEGDHYYVMTAARSFTVRGRLELGADQMLTVPGPLVSLDAKLSKGRLIEGDRLSGLEGSVLHFDPMIEGQEDLAKKAPPVFRLSRAVRFGNETTFIYRLVSSYTSDLGVLELPLRYGEKVQDVQGSSGWRVDGTTLQLPTTGHDADITISGQLPSPKNGQPLTFKGDERGAYEWWMIEADPEHRIETAGEPKMVEAAQSPIPPSMPGARVFLVQRGQSLEVDARSLVRGDVLAAVARSHKRFVAITGTGELISDEVVHFDNNGLDHLMVTPAGKALYLSTDGFAERILRTEAGAKDVLVPVRPGTHNLRLQSLSDVRLFPMLGAITIPSSTYAMTTSTMDVTVGLPAGVRPLAVLGGDRLRTAFSFSDLVAVVVGASVAGFGFRTRRTRVLGGVVSAGLWFVSREGFVVANAALFVAGAVFVASRFLRGNRLLGASAVIAVVGLLGAREALTGKATEEPTREMFAQDPAVPKPETTALSASSSGGTDPQAGKTPVSLSLPMSETYVQTSRQLVTQERPFLPRVLFVTSSMLVLLQVAWLGLLAALAWAHRGFIAALLPRIKERLLRRPAPASSTQGGPFGGLSP